jgi:predicted transposase YbfD/YdcC
VYWRVGVLRAVLITSPGRTALGQFAMGPQQTEETDADKLKHTGEITNLPLFIAKLRRQYGDLVSNFTLDAGLWSKALFLAMNASGFGLLCALKENKPELHAEAARLLRIDMSRLSPQAESDWESSPRGKVRRRLWRTTRLDGWLGWNGLRQVFVIEQTTRDSNGKDTVELRYYVTNATPGMLSPSQLLRLTRLHWAIEDDCNWTFDMLLGEDDRRWCTENEALLVLGVIRMIAYNALQHLRKCHVVVRHARAAASPRPWRNLLEMVHDCFKALPRAFVAALAYEARKASRPLAALPGS